MFFRKQKSGGNDNGLKPVEPTELIQPTTVSTGTSVHGDIDCEGDLHVDGVVRGSVRGQRVVIGPDGVVEGEVVADDVMVRGTVKGPIHTRHVHLAAQSSVEGDISTSTLAMDTGARFSGAVWQEQDEVHQLAAVNGHEFTTPDWDAAEDNSFRPPDTVHPRVTGSDR